MDKFTQQIERDLNNAYETRGEAPNSGSFGKVYKMWHISLEEYRAVKVFTYDASKRLSLEQWREQLSREATLGNKLTKLRNSNIVQVYDFLPPDRTLSGAGYLVMEYIEGQSLSDLIEDNPNGLPPERVYAILAKLAAALDYIHERNIIHRDIKPDNIRFRDNREDEPVLLDFGIAVQIKSGSSAATVAGTMTYMAPEVLRGKTERWADLYSLGVVVYEMLTGRLRDNTEFDFDNIPMTALRPVIEKAVNFSPDRRYRTGHEMVEAFRRAIIEGLGQKGDRAFTGTILIPPSANAGTGILGHLPIRAGIALVGILVVVGVLTGVLLSRRQPSPDTQDPPIIANAFEASKSPESVSIMSMAPTSTVLKTTVATAKNSPTKTSTVPPTEAITATTKPVATKVPFTVTATLSESPMPSKTPLPPTRQPSATSTFSPVPPSATAAPTDVPATNTPAMTPTPELMGMTWQAILLNMNAATGNSTDIDCAEFMPAFVEIQRRADLLNNGSPLKTAVQGVLKAQSATRSFYTLCEGALSPQPTLEFRQQPLLDRMHRELDLALQAIGEN